MKARWLAGCAGLLMSGLLGTGAAQAVTYNLDIDHCTGGCSTGVTPFGTVTVNQNGANLDFAVSLNSPYIFNKSTGLDAFVFGLSGDPAITITNPTAGFSVDASATVGEDGFGTFFTGIKKDATGGSSLSFTVLNQLLASLVISTNPPGDTPVLFAADISGDGVTGAVGGSTLACPTCAPPPAETPIPGALPLFTSGMGVLGFLGWRRKRRMARQAA